MHQTQSSRSLRIAFVAGQYEPDHCGVSHYTERLRSRLAQAGVDSVILTTRESAARANDPSVLGVVRDWHFPSVPQLASALSRLDVDVLHIQHAPGTYRFRRPIFLLPLMLRLKGWLSPIVSTIHEYGAWEWWPRAVPRKMFAAVKEWGQRKGIWDSEDGFLLTGSSAIICTDAEAETIIRRRLPNLAPRLHRIPVGPNVECYPAKGDARLELRRLCGWPENAPVAVFFGFLHPMKGIETLLTSFKRVLWDMPEARLLLLGGVESFALPADEAREYWSQMETLVDRLGMTGFVHMTGYMPDEIASRRLAGCDVGVLPHYGGVDMKSGSLLTLLLHGIPTVVTESPLLDSGLSRGGVVRLAPPRNAEALASSVMQLLRSEEERRARSLASLEFVRSYQWPEITARHVEIYESVRRNQPRPAATRA